eukprot:scaffold2529_cov122-Isochrysis_galbana.AAC.5
MLSEVFHAVAGSVASASAAEGKKWEGQLPDATPMTAFLAKARRLVRAGDTGMATAHVRKRHHMRSVRSIRLPLQSRQEVGQERGGPALPVHMKKI